MFELHYRPSAKVEDLGKDECTMHRASGGPGGRYWHLWLRVARETDGELEDFAVPVIVSGPYAENGPGGRSWGFDRAGVGRWLVSPSINVLNDDGARQNRRGARAHRAEPLAPERHRHRRARGRAMGEGRGAVSIIQLTGHDPVAGG